MRTEIDVHAYVQDLERHLQLTLFGGKADPEGAVLLVRGALAAGDMAKAAEIAATTRRLASVMPGNPDMAAAAEHAQGLLERDPAALDRAAGGYAAVHAQASALEDAGNAWAARGDQSQAAARYGQAHDRYEQLGAGAAMARVRACLREVGVRRCHWTHEDRPAFGWDSLTETERRIAGLVAQGLSNRQVANQVYLSTHTVAFHLRHVFWKLGVTSRVQLARIAAERDTAHPDGRAS